MLTRLKVSGFKNLVDVDVRFGPFTCVAGANAVGKSNLFDAIHFLSLLADKPLVEAALLVRDESAKTSDLKSLFHRFGDTIAEEMSFEADMIIPEEGTDDLGQKAKATTTFLRYSLLIARSEDYEGLRPLGSLEIRREVLTRITQESAHKELPFPHKVKWRKSAIKGRRYPAFISTDREGDEQVIKLHQDGGGGRTLRRLAANLPRTVLSVANAAESPTVLLAKREMQSWKFLQLEPSSLRQPDGFAASTKLGTDGSHLASTLYHLARRGNGTKGDDSRRTTGGAASSESRIYARIANRLSELIDDIYDVRVDRDERRELLTLQVTDRHGTTHSARLLSDGTLRFLALAVIELDPETKGLLCLEEPENGIHPQRIPAMLRLLEDIAVDPMRENGPDNPLRQVIINTHSPAVVLQVPEESLIIAELQEAIQSGRRFKKACFGSLSGTWRAGLVGDPQIVSLGKLLSYLNPAEPEGLEAEHKTSGKSDGPARTMVPGKRRVIDRPDMRQLRLPLAERAKE